MARKMAPAVLALAASLAMSGCSVRKIAVNKLGDALANGGATYASGNDPEFIGQTVPFSLKLIKGLLVESPDHRGLLFAAASGYTQYSYVYVQLPAEEVATADVGKSAALSHHLQLSVKTRLPELAKPSGVNAMKKLIWLAVERQDYGL